MECMSLSVGWLILSVIGSFGSLYGTGNCITCTEGRVPSSTYVRDYIVKKRPVLEFLKCQRDSDIEFESPLPPGKPLIQGTVLDGESLQITWRPPDDGSVAFLTGFLVELYVESRDYMAGPDACYIVDLTNRSNININREIGLEGPLQQDAVFSLSCFISGTENCTRVDVYVTSLPLPLWDTIKADNATISAGKCDTGKLRRRSSKPTGPEGASFLPVITISIGVMVVMVTTIIVIVCYKRRNQKESPEMEAPPATTNNVQTTETDLTGNAYTERVVLLRQTTLSDDRELTLNPPLQSAICERSFTQEQTDHTHQRISGEEVIQNSHRSLCMGLARSTINTSRSTSVCMANVRPCIYQTRPHHNHYKRSHSVPEEFYHHSGLHGLDTRTCAYLDRAIHYGDSATSETMPTDYRDENKIPESQQSRGLKIQTGSMKRQEPSGTHSEITFPEEFRKFAMEVNKETVLFEQSNGVHV